MKTYREFIRRAMSLGAAALRDGLIHEGTLEDYDIALAVATNAQTILFPADQVLALRPALAEFADRVDHRLPFPAVLLQFDRPIPEHIFFAVERPEYSANTDILRQMVEHWHAAGLKLRDWTPTDGDAVAALLLYQGESAAVQGQVYNYAIAWFVSTAINRVYWVGTDLIYRDTPTDADVDANKRTLRNLAVACIAYINCINLELERHDPPEAVQRRRQRENKPALDAWYTVEVRAEYRRAWDGDGTGAGSHHGYRYDVRGHFRRMTDGRMIWVRPHQRGLAHELYVPSVRRVD